MHLNDTINKNLGPFTFGEESKKDLVERAAEIALEIEERTA